MCLLRYLTFEDYQSLGGKCTEDTFPKLQYDIESSMDYITFGRLSKMIEKIGTVPEEVQYLEAKLLDKLYKKGLQEEERNGLTSYSNGIESFSYDVNSNSSSDEVENIRSAMMQYLYPKYKEIFYRGRVVSSDWDNNPIE